MYHLELRQFPHVARVFNLDRGQLDVQFLRPWVGGAMIEHDDRRWAPDRTRLKVLEGPRLSRDEMGLGRGWATASRTCEDVTATVIAEAQRGASARPEVEALKDAIGEVASTPISFGDVMALAEAAHPNWRPSEQLGLAEQVVWEMLHQGRIRMLIGGRPVARERWQPLLLNWATWSGAATEPVALESMPA